MRFTLIPFHFFWWHYTTAISDLTRNYFNFLAFLGNFFSIKQLLFSLFKPWRRLGEDYPGRFNPEAFFSALIVNTLMRLVGAFIRLLFIIIGLVTMASSFIFFFIALFFWLALPLIIILLIILGFKLLATS